MSTSLPPDGCADLVALFAQHRERLRLAVALRLDRRLRARLDPSDVLQEAFLEAAARWSEFTAAPGPSPYLWLRFLTLQRVVLLHRQHLGVRARDARREVCLAPSPDATSDGLAAHLADSLTTPSEAILRAEREAHLREAIDRLEPLDREVLALRHFEQLTNAEAAELLGIARGAASTRYFRALQRLREALDDWPGPLGEDPP